MKVNTVSRWYNAWRRSEAHMCPLTVEGIEQAKIRADNFKLGFEAGIKAAAVELEKQHSAAKKQHSFFLLASRIVKEIK